MAPAVAIVPDASVRNSPSKSSACCFMTQNLSKIWTARESSHQYFDCRTSDLFFQAYNEFCCSRIGIFDGQRRLSGDDVEHRIFRRLDLGSQRCSPFL